MMEALEWAARYAETHKMFNQKPERGDWSQHTPQTSPTEKLKIVQQLAKMVYLASSPIVVAEFGDTSYARDPDEPF